MSYLILQALILCSLILAGYYIRSLDSYAALEKKLVLAGRARIFALLPLALFGLNLILLRTFSATEIVYASIFFLLTFCALLLQCIRRVPVGPAFLGAACVTEMLFLLVLITKSEMVNNLLVILAYLAAVSLLLLRIKLTDAVWRMIFIAAAVLDAIFVSLTPAATQLDETLKPYLFTYSPLLRSGDHSIGAGDYIFLLIAMLLLAQHTSAKKSIGIAFILSLSVPISFFILETWQAELFPFLTVLAPLFIILQYGILQTHRR